MFTMRLALMLGAIYVLFYGVSIICMERAPKSKMSVRSSAEQKELDKTFLEAVKKGDKHCTLIMVT